MSDLNMKMTESEIRSFLPILKKAAINASKPSVEKPFSVAINWINTATPKVILNMIELIENHIFNSKDITTEKLETLQEFDKALSTLRATKGISDVRVLKTAELGENEWWEIEDRYGMVPPVAYFDLHGVSWIFGRVKAFKNKKMSLQLDVRCLEQENLVKGVAKDIMSALDKN